MSDARPSFSEKYDECFRRSAGLLATPFEALESWEAVARADREAVEFLHEARNLISRCRVEAAAQGVDCNSGSAMDIQRSLDQLRVRLSEFRRKVAGVMHRLRRRAASPKLEEDSALLAEARNIGLSDEEAAAYLRMAKRIHAADPYYAPGRRAAARQALDISELHQEFDTVLERTRGKNGDPKVGSGPATIDEEHWETRALLLIREKPDLNVAEYARALGIARTTMYKSEVVKRALKLRGSSSRLRKGIKTKEGGVEAVDHADESDT